MLCNTEFCSLCEKAGLLRVCFRVWFCKARKLPFQTGDFPAICGRTKYVQNKRKPQLAPASAEYPTLHRMGGTVGRHPGGSEAFPNAQYPHFRHAAKHFGRRLSANLIFRKQRARFPALQTALAGENPGGSGLRKLSGFSSRGQDGPAGTIVADDLAAFFIRAGGSAQRKGDGRRFAFFTPLRNTLLVFHKHAYRAGFCRTARSLSRAAKRFGRRRTPAAPKFSRTHILRLFTAPKDKK